MNKFCIFAGTTEGRKLVEFLSAQPCAVTACVATDYGSTLLTPAETLTILEKRLDAEAMAALLKQEQFDLVVDATHPYAAIVTENISRACAQTGTEYLRLLRERSREIEGAVLVPDAAGAVEYLNTVDGNILLTTGSKELNKYTAIDGFADRVYARVLPMPASLEACAQAGVKVSHIIAVQGPFSEKMNLAMLESTGAKYLVTKDGGTTGGFAEKASAAEKAGVRLVIIGRPAQLSGKSFAEVLQLFADRYGYTAGPQVTIVGIGPGSLKAMTQEVKEAIENADCLIGADRMLEAVKRPGQPCISAVASGQIAEHIRAHREFHSFTVVMSGDSGFFSGTKKLLPLLADCGVTVLPGLSSMSAFAAALGLSYENVRPVSMHGRAHDIVPDVRSGEQVFVLTGGDGDIKSMCRALEEAGLSDVTMHVAERLSYPEQKITSGRPADLLKNTFDKLSVVWIENPNASKTVVCGLPDDAFRRGEGQKGMIPMTKSEVRAVCLSKLRLTDRSVCWDIGAGTGSVSVEMALQAENGAVYAVEKNPDAVRLLQENKAGFRTENLVIVEGKAPKACEDLPAPDRVFIGGSSGELPAVIALAREKNPGVRIVATTVTLESAALLTDCLKQFEWKETEVVQISVSADRKAGPYHLMTAQNPIFIYTMQA